MLRPPILPAELQRYIFKLAVISDLRSIFVLFLVARRVQIWMEPLLYRNLSLHRNRPRLPTDPAFRRPFNAVQTVLDSKPAPFFHEVRRICMVDPDPSVARRILRVCSSTVEVMILCGPKDPGLLPVLGALPLRRLCISLDDLFPAMDNGLPVFNFLHPLFIQITHLDLLPPLGRARAEQEREWERWSGLAQIPHLTHLSFTGGTDGFYIRALLYCQSLAVLIATYTFREPRNLWSHSLLRNPRFLILEYMKLRDFWEARVAGGDDHWARGEVLVRQRRVDWTISPRLN
ncbi:hypothetical protein DFH06DRAFT_192110 [Mycena polygramma]|nr:hypothetical protein DFH06DRAFT_192110 [Mycena polygramma]